MFNKLGNENLYFTDLLRLNLNKNIEIDITTLCQCGYAFYELTNTPNINTNDCKCDYTDVTFTIIDYKNDGYYKYTMNINKKTIISKCKLIFKRN